MPPQGLPYWRTVHSCFWRWKRNGVLDRLHEALRARLGRDPAPSRGGDRQPKREDHGKRGSRGDDANKKVSGRKRHVLVDTQSLLLEVVVHPANVQEQAGGQTLLAAAKARPSCSRLAKVWADGGFDGEPFRDWVAKPCGWDLEVVAKPPGRKGFAVLRRRWVVERTFAWLGRSRRLSKDYEQRPDSGEADVRLAMTQLMLRRLRPEPDD